MSRLVVKIREMNVKERSGPEVNDGGELKKTK